MKKGWLIVLLLPVCCFAQRTFNITGMLLIGPQYQNISPIENGIIKVKSTQILITDSLYIEKVMGKIDSFIIAKKVNDKYFTISDGIRNYIVNITESAFKRYTGIIVMEGDDKNKTMLFFK